MQRLQTRHRRMPASAWGAKAERAWYGIVNEADGAWFRLLSRFQPLAHAMRVSEEGVSWLQDGVTYSAPWQSGSTYESMRQPVRP